MADKGTWRRSGEGSWAGGWEDARGENLGSRRNLGTDFRKNGIAGTDATHSQPFHQPHHHHHHNHHHHHHHHHHQKTNSESLINASQSSLHPANHVSTGVSPFTRERSSDVALSNGPAAPLKPLFISSSTLTRPLPHPAAYSGSESNWAFTPSDTLPSLPATPSRSSTSQPPAVWGAPNSGTRTGTPTGSDTGSSGYAQGSRESAGAGTGNSSIGQPLSATRLFNRRLEEQRHHSPSPGRNQRSSPKVGYATLGVGSANQPNGLAALAGGIPSSGVRNLSISDGLTGSIGDIPGASSQYTPPSIASMLSNKATGSADYPSPSLQHRESVTSLASSTQHHSLGHHPLAHSRRPSQIFVQSPTAQSTTSNNSNVRATPSYRVYRPPHLRTESYYGLQPRVAHYDRVTAPNMRGQSRSPSFSVSNTASSAASRTPSESRSLSPSSNAKRRLSSLGAHNTILQAASGSSGGGSNTHFTTLDSSSLIAKLANAKLDLRPTLSDNNSPRTHYSGQRDDMAVDDVDLSAEDMMMMSGTLTDQFCRSRSTSISISESEHIVDIFDVGDRLGPGMQHDGHTITIAETSEGFSDQDADWSGTQLEVVSKLGEGSYAIVYLVKEVPRHARGEALKPDDIDSTASEDVFGTSTSTVVDVQKRSMRNGSNSFASDEADETIHQNGDIYSSTLKASSSGRLADDTLVEDDTKVKGGEKDPVSAKERLFALKCLCKRDLSDEMLEVQRLEATIHQSIPSHPYIVTLYRTYETAEWLFLILEYCPGQDLFYWLEQAQDSEKLGAATPGGDDLTTLTEWTNSDSTPPSPSLLASTESRFLLSRRRLRLISRMFQQICEAVDFCHARGISHRDLKPENFIVEDTRAPDDEMDGGGSGSEGVKVKLTDFGLAVAQTRCIDFDCGSKPYMSYECRNNTTQWYNPIESDIWSLGIVLLNLIFHRNPFAEPNAERCPSFASYIQDPIRFLMMAFRGLKREAARFLAEKVFCDVTEGDENSRRRRITAREFGEWAENLEDHLNARGGVADIDSLSLSPAGSAPGADLGITSPLWHSRSPVSSNVNSVIGSPMGNARSLNIHQELTTMGISEEEIANFTPLFNDAGSISEKEIDVNPLDADPLLTNDTERSVAEKNDLRDIDEKEDGESIVIPQQTKSIETHDIAAPSAMEETPIGNVPSVVDDHSEIGAQNGDGEGEGDADSLLPPASATSTSAQSKRRKRGARKGRTLAKQQLKRSRSVENLLSEESKANVKSSNDDERDAIIRELAEASQSLAREMSKAINHKNQAKSMAEVSPLTDNDPDALPRPAVAESQAHSGFGHAQHSRLQGRLPHPSSTAADWRERNASQASLASISSINTVNSFSSDIGSIRSTASAPPALLYNRGRGHSSSFGGATTVSSTSSSRVSSNLAALRSSGSGALSSGRSVLPSSGGQALGTINERSVPTPQEGHQKKLDASYLAEIFGGGAGPGGERRPSSQAKGANRDFRYAPRPAHSTTSVSGHVGSPSSSRASHGNGSGLLYGHQAGGIQGGVLEAASKASFAADKQKPKPSSQTWNSSPLADSDPTAVSARSELPSASHAAKASNETSLTSSDTDPGQGASESAHTSSSLGPRKKMLGKFLQGVKSYNKGVRAAPAFTHDDGEQS